jgi:hypothetical protein
MARFGHVVLGHGHNQLVRAGLVPPGDPGAVDVEDGIHNAAQVVLGRAADVRALTSALGSPGGERTSQLPNLARTCPANGVTFRMDQLSEAV